jgi:hypothetical protein
VKTPDYIVIDRQYCGSEIVRCQTINYIDGTLNRNADHIINVADGEYEEWKLESQKKHVRGLRGSSVSETKIIVVKKEEYTYSMFNIRETCNNATFDISTLTFLINTTLPLILMESNDGIANLADVVITSKDVSRFQTSNIIHIIRGCFIKFNNVQFINFTLSSCSLLKAQSINMKILSSNFHNISSSVSNGGVIDATVVGMRTIEIADACWFENCSINNDGTSNGGALYINLKEGYLNVGGNTIFKKCSALSSQSEEGKGFDY